MQDSRETFASIHRLLQEEGVVILHTGRVPVNPVNLFDMLVVENGKVIVEVDDDFVGEMHDRASDPVRTH